MQYNSVERRDYIFFDFYVFHLKSCLLEHMNRNMLISCENIIFQDYRQTSSEQIRVRFL
jgi:hypothetical protein